MLSHLLWTDPSTFEKGIDNIQSNLRPEDTLVWLTLGGRKIAKKLMYTPSYFSCLELISEFLKSGGIFLLYSDFIPFVGPSQWNFRKRNCYQVIACQATQCCDNLRYSFRTWKARHRE